MRAGQGRRPAAGPAWELPVWDKPATPCLSSRIAYGEEVTPERLAMIDQAEQFLRERGLRHAPGALPQGRPGADRSPGRGDRAAGRCRDARKVLAELRRIGFKYVTLDLEGFRSGSMNRVLESGDCPSSSRRPAAKPISIQVWARALNHG